MRVCGTVGQRIHVILRRIGFCHLTMRKIKLKIGDKIITRGDRTVR